MPKYYILTGRHREDPAPSTEYIFGAYDREDVEYEKEAEAISYARLRIHVLPDSRQETIDKHMASLRA